MSDDDFADVPSGKTSKYNSALAQLYRIDALWQDAHNHSRSGELIKWNWDLDRVWCELAADSQEKIEEMDAINELVKKSVGFPVSLYQILMKKEIFLRTLQNKQGKGTAYEESIEEYMDG